MVDELAVRRQVATGLRRARRRAGLTEEQLAEAIAMSRSGLRHLEAARHAIRVEQLPTLAHACGVTVRQLLTDMRLLRRAPARPQNARAPGSSLAGQPDGTPTEPGALWAAPLGTHHGSALGDRSTVADPRGDADPPQSTPPSAPVRPP